jgi:hypothetical protein
MCTNSPDACPPTISFATQSGQTRLCNTDADCTSGTTMSQLKTCCTYKGMNALPYHACANANIAAFSQGQITCP